MGINLLLVFIPVAAALDHLAPDRHVGVFLAAALAIVPLAGMMGDATEELAERAGEGVGGLLNATFGNAPELIITITALRGGLHDVIKAAIAGSIIGNLLLVPGAAMLAGGLRLRRQRFNAAAARSQATMLLLAVIALMLPAVYHARVPAEALRLEGLSVGISLVLIACYLCGLVFALVTHRDLFMGEERVSGAAGRAPVDVRRAVLRLALATLGTAWMSELLVGSVGQASAGLGLNTVFVSVFVVALVGNVAALLTAVRAARRDRLDLALAIGMGSGVQVALFLSPVLVLASLVLGPRPLDLAFLPGLVLAVFLSVAACTQVAGDGESNWLKGVQMLAVYAILAMASFFIGGTAQVD